MKIGETGQELKIPGTILNKTEIDYFIILLVFDWLANSKLNCDWLIDINTGL